MWNTEPRVIYSRPKIPVWISGNFQWRINQNISEYFWKTEEPRKIYPNFWNFLTENFRYIEVFPVFSRIFRLNCAHFRNSTVYEFSRLFQDISVHLLQLRNFWNFCLNRKHPSLFLTWLTFDRWNVIGLVTITRRKEQRGMTYTEPMSRTSA